MKFSIITVCYNAAGKIEKTIESVISQTCSEFEYIIIDGGSDDGTAEIVKRYMSDEKMTGKVFFVSEKDNGLYDAMNKGAQLAKGDYVQFLNAGDELFDENVLAKVFEKMDLSDERPNDCTSQMCQFEKTGKIYYGNIVYINPDGTTDLRLYGKTCGKPIYFATGDCVNHQAIFAPRAALLGEEKTFCDDVFAICADRDWMMRLTKKGAKWIALDETVVKYELSDESISIRDKDTLRREERLCLKKNYPGLLPIYFVFDFARNNKVLAKILHWIYKKLYIQ